MIAWWLFWTLLALSVGGIVFCVAAAKAGSRGDRQLELEREAEEIVEPMLAEVRRIRALPECRTRARR